MGQVFFFGEAKGQEGLSSMGATQALLPLTGLLSNRQIWSKPYAIVS